MLFSFFCSGIDDTPRTTSEDDDTTLEDDDTTNEGDDTTPEDRSGIEKFEEKEKEESKK